MDRHTHLFGSDIDDLIGRLDDMRGASVPRIAPPTHQRSVRAEAMALQVVLDGVVGSLPTDERSLELEIEGELIDVVLGPKPTATARSSNRRDARARITPNGMRAILQGLPADPASITHVAGDEGTTGAFITALA